MFLALLSGAALGKCGAWGNCEEVNGEDVWDSKWDHSYRVRMSQDWVSNYPKPVQTTNISLMFIIEMRILDDFGASSILRQSHSKGGDGRSLKLQDILLKPSWIIMAGTADPLEHDFRLKTLGTRIYKIVLRSTFVAGSTTKHGSEFLCPGYSFQQSNANNHSYSIKFIAVS